MEAKFNQQKNKAIDKYDGCFWAQKKSIKVEQIKQSMRLFGDRDDNEEDDDDADESSEFSDEETNEG